MSFAKLPPDDAEALERWLGFCAAHGGALPPDVDVVQARLVRGVGRGRLPSGADAYLKAMGFPRLRDRFRYWLRALPSAHEAAMLRRAERAGIQCPRVLGTVERRGAFGAPVASVLATAGLARGGGAPPRLRECAELARRLAEARIAHGDLHDGNFVRLGDGTCAVLDLQSARRNLFGVRRLPLAARLLAADWPEPESPDAVVEGGLLGASELARALQWAQALRRDAVRRRVARCQLDSTEFCVQRRAWGRWIQRRTVRAGGHWRHGGRELLSAWVGARYREVSAGEPSPLGVLCQPWGGFGHWAVYVDPALDGEGFAALAPKWQAAHAGFVSLCRMNRWPSLAPAEPLPWSGQTGHEPSRG